MKQKQKKEVILHENICCMCKLNTHRADFVSYSGFFSSPLEARVKDCVEDVCTIYLPHNNQMQCTRTHSAGPRSFWFLLLLLLSFPFVCAVLLFGRFFFFFFLLSFAANIFFCVLQTVCVYFTYFIHCTFYATFFFFASLRSLLCFYFIVPQHIRTTFTLYFSFGLWLAIPRYRAVFVWFDLFLVVVLA